MNNTWVLKEELVAQCAELGLHPGDIVMVHASLRAVGEILGGPDVLIDAIATTIGPEGTILVYTGCQAPFDDVGRGIYSSEQELLIRRHCPPFDANTARASRDFGALAELFRTRPQVISSQNVGARMSALGAEAHWITAEHSMNYGLGIGSPLEKLCEREGKVMLIGSDWDNVTLLHYAEALAPINNKRLVHIAVPVSNGNKTEWLDVEEFDSSVGIRVWPDSFFATIIDKFCHATNIKSGLIGRAPTMLLDAQDLVEFAVKMMVETANAMD